MGASRTAVPEEPPKCAVTPFHHLSGDSHIIARHYGV